MLQKFRTHPNIIQLIDYASHSIGHSHIENSSGGLTLKSISSFMKFSQSSNNSSTSNNAREVYLLFPLYYKGTTWDIIERCLGSDNIPWPFNERKCLSITLGILRALR